MSRSRIRIPLFSLKLHVRPVITYHVMVLRHGATVSIGSISHVRKLAMLFAKHEITAYGIGVALTDMTFIQSLV
jgi:hypothetical protein